MIKLTGYFNKIFRDEPDGLVAVQEEKNKVGSSTFFVDDDGGASGGEEQPVSISRLLNESYSAFPHITREANEKMRLRHRLQVVQSIEDTQMKNVLRSVKDSAKATSQEELKALYCVVKNEQLQRTSSSSYVDAAEKQYDPSQPYYDLYRVDLDTFKSIFLHVSPWGSAPEMGLILAERIFRLMDRNDDGLLSFKELVQTLEALCKGDHARKAQLLYCLHLPGVVLPGELETPDSVDGAEVACDAADFFDAVDDMTESLEKQLHVEGTV